MAIPLELFEYVVASESKIVVKSYTYHWQDSEGKLKKRWDNAEHHHRISTYPDHLHDGEEPNIVASEAMNFDRVSLSNVKAYNSVNLYGAASSLPLFHPLSPEGRKTKRKE